jgi:hypothetical protein
MMRDNIRCGRRAAYLGAALASVAAVATPSAPAMAASRTEAKLSPRLARLTAPKLRNASPARQARALGLAPGRLGRAGSRLLADVRFRRGALAARDELRGAGAKVVASSGRYQTVTVAVPPGRLRAVTSVPGVASVSPVLTPILAATCPSGDIVSEGDEQLRADEARQGPPARDGSGVTVGILSDSFDQATDAATNAQEDVETADLPGATCPGQTEVNPVGDPDEAEEPPSDEGRAMTQIVHDLAPGAALSFASAFNGETAFAQNIHALAEAGADVIADDVFYPAEPFFQDGPIAVAAREVVEEGVVYFSAAGNDNLIDAEGNRIGSWETPEYREAGGCPPAVQALSGANGSHCLDFNPAGGGTDRTFGVRVAPGTTLTVDMQWDEPWEGVETELDAYLLNSTGGLLRQSREENLAEQVPVEYLEWPNNSSSTRTVQIVINRRLAGEGDPAVKFALLDNGEESVEGIEYPRSSGGDVVGPTIYGHSGTAAAISVAATGSPTALLLGANEPETYSSRGPVRHDFGPVEGGGAAEELPAPELISKPDLTATDCVQTTFFSFELEAPPPVGGWYFCGTSAAVPHAAAVAALMLEAAPPGTEPEQIREALISGVASPSPFDSQYGPCDVGAGLVDAVKAIEELSAPSGSAPICEPPESEVEPDEARAPGDWGSETSPPGGGSTTPPVIAPPSETRKAPRTFFRLRPLKVVQTPHRRARVVFLFGSNAEDATFVCRIDGGLFRPCPARLVRRFPLGVHVIRVSARDSSGNGDRTPARYRFRVEQIR